MLEDCAIFWTSQADPAAKRQFLALVVESVWLDEQRNGDPQAFQRVEVALLLSSMR